MPGVIVIGGANVDIKGRMAGTLTLGTSMPGEMSVTVGGVGRNIAENISRLGLDVALLSVVGNDPNGQLVLAESEAAGIDMSMVARLGQPTGAYLAILDARGELVSAVNAMGIVDAIDVSQLELHSSRLCAAEFLVADCNLREDCLAWIIALAERHSIRLVIDPVSVAKSAKLLAAARRHAVFAITPNRQQMTAMSGIEGPSDAAQELNRMGFGAVIAHLGREGVLVSRPGEPQQRLPSYAAVDIADVTGAGDAAVAGLVFGLHQGYGFGDAARIGQAAAAIKLSSLKSVAELVCRDRVLSMAGLKRVP